MSSGSSTGKRKEGPTGLPAASQHEEESEILGPEEADNGGQHIVVATHFQGPLPSPEILRQFEEVVPGAAQSIVDLMTEEAVHRRSQEKRYLDLEEKSIDLDRSIARNRLIARAIAFTLSFGCLSGSVFLAMNGHTKVALALVSLPIMAVAGTLASDFFRPDAATRKKSESAESDES